MAGRLRRKIFIGTAGYEFSYGEQSLTSVFGAGNTKVELNSTIGSNEVQAERLLIELRLCSVLGAR